jgi:hypothetical protein
LRFKDFLDRQTQVATRSPTALPFLELKKLPSDAAEKGNGRLPKGAGKVRLLTLADLDSRTRAAKHALELRDGFLSDLGGADYASTAKRELAQRASILGAMLEDQEARWLRGDGTDLAEYCTLVNAQRRVLSDIGLERRQRDVTPPLTLT